MKCWDIYQEILAFNLELPWKLHIVIERDKNKLKQTLWYVFIPK